MITLGGQPLLMPDSEGELLRWQEAFQAARQYDLFAEPTSLASNKNGTQRESARTGPGLPIANYPEPPEARINQLYWPTGATRWARGYFLAADPAVTRIISKSANYTTPLDLKIANSDAVSGLTIKVYLLPPRPITYSEASNDRAQLWLIPVVDERYFWNHQYGAVDLATDPATTWAELYDDLTTQAGIAAANAISISPPASYLIPDKNELQRINDNAAVLLDAVCLSTGHRFVTKFDGKHTPERPSSAQTIIDARNNTTFQKIAGGAGTAFAAASTLVTFNKFKDGRPLESGEQYTKSVALSQSTVKSKSGTFNVVHSSCLADYSGGTIINQTNCDNLATQIEADYAAWAKYRYDSTIAGVSEDIIPCGYDDSITMTFGAQRFNEEKKEYEYEAHTRVKTYPLNFGVEAQLSQDPLPIVLSHFQKAVPFEDVAAGASGFYHFLDTDGTPYLDEDGDEVLFNVFNEFGPDAVAVVDIEDADEVKEKTVYVHWQEEEEKWKTLSTGNANTTLVYLGDPVSSDTYVEPDASGVYDARLVEISAPGPATPSSTEIWLIVSQKYVGDCTSPLPIGLILLASKQGFHTVGVGEAADERPLYYADHYQWLWCQLDLSMETEIADGATGNAVVLIDDGTAHAPEIAITVRNRTGVAIQNDAKVFVDHHAETGEWWIRHAPDTNAAIAKAKVYDATIAFNGSGVVNRWDCEEDDYSADNTTVTNRTRPLFKDELITVGKDECGEWLALNVDSHTLEGTANAAIAKGASGSVTLGELTDDPVITAWSYLGEIAENDIVYVIWFNGKWRIIAAECPEVV